MLCSCGYNFQPCADFVSFSRPTRQGFFVAGKLCKMLKLTTTPNQAPKCVNLSLTHDEVTQLRDLIYKAHWYNNECNYDNDNDIIYTLIEERDNNNRDQIDAAITMLNKVGYLSSFLTDLWNRLLELEKECV